MNICYKIALVALVGPAGIASARPDGQQNYERYGKGQNTTRSGGRPQSGYVDEHGNYVFYSNQPEFSAVKLAGGMGMGFLSGVALADIIITGLQGGNIALAAVTTMVGLCFARPLRKQWVRGALGPEYIFPSGAGVAAGIVAAMQYRGCFGNGNSGLGDGPPPYGSQ